METAIEKRRLKKKQDIANDISIFFKILKITTPIGIVLFCVLYFLIFRIPESKKPDVLGVWSLSTNDKYISFTNRYGNDWNEKVWRWYVDHYNCTFSIDQFLMIRAHDTWVEDKSKLTIILSLSEFLGIPILFILARIILRRYFRAKQWIDENKTI
jgi:hypothetical protein